MSSVGTIFVMPAGTIFPTDSLVGDLFFRIDLDKAYVYTSSGWVDITATAGPPIPHAPSHQHGGLDEVATAIPSPNAIPKADTNGSLTDWITPVVYAADPPGPSAQGSTYFNSTINRLMYYDSSRSKWMTVECLTFQVGEDGDTPSGVFYKGLDGRTLSNTLGFIAGFNGVLVGAIISRTDTLSTNIHVQINGVTGVSIPSSTTLKRDMSLNVNFNQGDVISVRNDPTGQTTQNAQISLFLRWRS